jgi:hypothetical protein
MQGFTRGSIMNLMTATCTGRADHNVRSGSNRGEKAIFADRHREFISLLGVAETSSHTATTGVQGRQLRAENPPQETRGSFRTPKRLLVAMSVQDDAIERGIGGGKCGFHGMRFPRAIEKLFDECGLLCDGSTTLFRLVACTFRQSRRQ